jgi:TetR/AcrR family transcriptional repressor of bet genes
MKAGKKTARASPKAARPRAAHGRQRQRLIDACISALHVYGPSRTTVEKVVAIANMSPGIVRFYFDSKAAMLVASLQHLSAEFEERVLAPVTRLQDTPVAALESLVDLYLDPELASSRKVSVWYSFWGEASSRQEYYDICGQKDERFASLIRGLVERLIRATGQTHLDPDGVALGLIGVLEMLWQGFAFQAEVSIDRAAAKHRCMAYLRSIFPGEFALVRGAVAARPAARTPPAADEAPSDWFRSGWQLLGHEAQLPRTGDFLCAETPTERVILLRDARGTLRCFRDNCPAQPHPLLGRPRGQLDGAIECPTHGLRFGLDGTGWAGAPDLVPLELALSEGLVFAAPPQRAGPPPNVGDWIGPAAHGALRPLLPVQTLDVAAHWVVVFDQWLDLHPPTPTAPCGWSAQRYRNLLRRPGDLIWRRRLCPPNQLIEVREDGMTVLQVRPLGPRRCRIVRFDFGFGEHPVTGPALQYLAGRIVPHTRRRTVELMEQVERGIAEFGYAPRLTADRIVTIMKASEPIDS